MADDDRSYTKDEVNAILTRALERQQRDLTSHRELVETAREIGLSPDAIDAAAREIAAARAGATEERLVRERLRRALFNHAFSYFVVLAFLLAVNLLASPGYMWVVWPALGWGLGLLFHARAALFPDERRVARIAARKSRRDRARARVAESTRTRVADDRAREEEAEEEAAAEEEMPQRSARR